MEKVFALSEKNIHDSAYYAMMDVCFANAQYFSLTKGPVFLDNDIATGLSEELAGFLVRRFTTNHWHCYHMLDLARPLTVSLYEANAITHKALCASCQNLFMEIAGYSGENDRRTYYAAEDICFFKNKELLLGTVSHAEMATFYPQTEELLATFRQFAPWEERECLRDEMIILEI